MSDVVLESALPVPASAPSASVSVEIEENPGNDSISHAASSELGLILPEKPTSMPTKFGNFKRNFGRYLVFSLLIIFILGLIGFFLILPAQRAAIEAASGGQCKCGWFTDPGTNAVWTNSIVAQFDSMKKLSQTQDMVPVRQTITSDGIYAKAYTPDQISFGSGGLELNVMPLVNNASLPSAQLQSVRTDILYGSFRAMVKLPADGGTVSSMQYYFNDTNEIDIELLGSFYGAPTQFFGSQTGIKGSDDGLDPRFWKNTTYPANAVTEFLEYRFDWFPTHIDFFLNGNKFFTVSEKIPTMPGNIILNHWAGGGLTWEGAAPTRKQTMVVKSFKAYFNSTSNAKGCPSSTNYCSY